MRRLGFKVVVFVVVLEAISGFLLARQSYWYAEAANRVARGPVDFIFVGSSRVAQAVVAGAFSAEAGRAGDKTLNLGRGYSTMAEHYFGLRRLAASSPRGLVGTVVMVEAPEGIPDLSTWAHPWFQAEDPSLLLQTMQASDLPAFWSRSAGSFEEKASITAGELSSLAGLRGSWSYYARAGWRSLTGRTQEGGNEQGELSEAGGVKTGREGFVAARQLAEVLAVQALRDQRELDPARIDQAILLSLVSFLERERASLVVYWMPMSSVQKRTSATQIGTRNREAVAVALNRARVPLLRVDFPTSDDDFPDLWHLRKSRAGDFSRALARAYLASRR